MKVELKSIYNRGSDSEERVHFQALADIDLTYYAIFDTHYTGENSIQASQKSCYWIPPRKVKSGEHVVVYTRTGKVSVETRNDGSVYHFLFRGLAHAIYKSPQDCAVLFEISTWKTAK